MKDIVLVGAKHGVTVSGGMFGAVNCEVEPSFNLADEIGLEDRSRIAVEIFPRALNEQIVQPNATNWDEVNYDLLDRARALHGEYFFRTLAANLLAQDHAVMPVDDERLCDVVAKDAFRLQDLSYHDDDEGFYSRKIKLWSRLRAKQNYFNSTLREDALFRNIRDVSSETDVVVVGLGHAARLSADESLQADLGIRVVRNYVVEPDVAYYQGFRNGDIVNSRVRPAEASEIATEAQRTQVQRELDRRRHMTHAVGRVLGSKASEPDFLGRFRITGCAADSLFELFVDDHDGVTFRGRMSDILGDAVVQGELDDSSIVFEKVYDLSTVEPQRQFVALTYTGKQDEAGKYEGRWRPSEQSFGGYVFRMIPFGKNAIRSLELW